MEYGHTIKIRLILRPSIQYSVATKMDHFFLRASPIISNVDV